MSRQVVLDTETTGLQTSDGHRIIEIGCIELINRKFTGKHFHQYINPERKIDEGALAVHGITEDFLLTKPVFSEVADEFLAFISGAELIIHNAPFDTGFIDYEFSLLNKKMKPIAEYCRITDTLVLARSMHVGQRNSLDALCKRYNVDGTKRDLHGALLDARLLAQVYLAMTGGQGSFFEGVQTEEAVEHQLDEILAQPLRPTYLKVIAATAEELAAHEQKLQKMAEKGKCLWLAQE